MRKYNTQLAIKMSFTHYRIACIDNMNPIAFEALAAQLLTYDGYEAGENTKASGDKGIDAWVKRRKKKKLFGFIPSADRIPVQMKLYSNKVQTKEIREFGGSMQHAGVDEGIFFTNNFFSSGCKEYFKSYNITKYDRKDLKKLLKKVSTKDFIKLYFKYIRTNYS